MNFNISEAERSAVCIKRLSKSFGGRPCLSGVNLTIAEGEVFALLGPNGAGKTTTLNILSSLLKKDSGSVEICGYDIDENPDTVRGLLSVSPQETALSPRLNAEENLKLMAGLYGVTTRDVPSKVSSLLDWAGLSDRAKEPVRRFSGGMQRILGIAMALISDPRVLLLDEPTLGLDPHARRKLWEQIEALKGTMTIILTTHYLEEADALADRIGIIDRGTILTSGTSAALKKELFADETVVIKTENMSSACMTAFKEAGAMISRCTDGMEVRGVSFDVCIELLKQKGETVRGVYVREPTLDDVFLSLTGNTNNHEVEK